MVPLWKNINVELYDACGIYEPERLLLVEGDVIPFVPLSFFLHNTENMWLEVSNILTRIHTKERIFCILRHTSVTGVHWSFSSGLCRILA